MQTLFEASEECPGVAVRKEGRKEGRKGGREGGTCGLIK